MFDTTCHMSISLDGFVAGPEQSRDNPLGKRGGELHGWHIGDPRATEADKMATGWLMRPRGAYVMGRNMFGPIRGEWNEAWDGWWGSEPPITPGLRAHSPRPRTCRDGGRDNLPLRHRRLRRRLARALKTADGNGVDIAGGASTVRQALNAGVIDELTLDIAPVLLGSGERMFDGVQTFDLEPIEVLHSPLTTHIRYGRSSAAKATAALTGRPRREPEDPARWARHDPDSGLFEMVIDAGPFHVLTQRPGAGEPGAVGSTAELTGVLVSVREYEFEAFDLPDVRQRWRVLSVAVHHTSGRTRLGSHRWPDDASRSHLHPAPPAASTAGLPAPGRTGIDRLRIDNRWRGALLGGDAGADRLPHRVRRCVDVAGSS